MTQMPLTFCGEVNAFLSLSFSLIRGIEQRPKKKQKHLPDWRLNVSQTSHQLSATYVNQGKMFFCLSCQRLRTIFLWFSEESETTSYLGVTGKKYLCFYDTYVFVSLEKKIQRDSLFQEPSWSFPYLCQKKPKKRYKQKRNLFCWCKSFRDCIGWS